MNSTRIGAGSDRSIDSPLTTLHSDERYILKQTKTFTTGQLLQAKGFTKIIKEINNNSESLADYQAAGKVSEYFCDFFKSVMACTFLFWVSSSLVTGNQSIYKLETPCVKTPVELVVLLSAAILLKFATIYQNYYVGSANDIKEGLVKTIEIYK